MRISRTEAPIHITVQNEEIEQVDGFKYLGSWIDKEEDERRKSEQE